MHATRQKFSELRQQISAVVTSTYSEIDGEKSCISGFQVISRKNMATESGQRKDGQRE